MDSGLTDSGMEHVRKLLNETPLPPLRAPKPNREDRLTQALGMLDDAYDEIWRNKKDMCHMRFVINVLFWALTGAGAALVFVLALDGSI